MNLHCALDFFIYSLSFSRNTHSESFHRTFAERMTPYIGKKKCWEDVLPTITVFLHYIRHIDLTTVQKDWHEYNIFASLSYTFNLFSK